MRDIAVYVGQAEVSSSMPAGELLVIKTHEMQNRRMQIANVNIVFFCSDSELCERVVKTIFDRSNRDRLQTCPTFFATLGFS